MIYRMYQLNTSLICTETVYTMRWSGQCALTDQPGVPMMTQTDPK